MERQKSNIGSFMKGILLGGILGGMVALFAAPRPGTETRRLLRDKSEQMREKTMQTLENAREQVDTVISDTRQRADNIVQRLGVQTGSQTH